MANSVSKVQVLLVVCLAHDGYRRAGMALKRGENSIPLDDLSEAQVAALKADKRLRVSESEVASEEGRVDVPDGDKALSFSDAIAKLDPDNRDHFTGGGKPQCAALEALMGKAISASERDALWAEYQATLDNQDDKGE
ncbi:HI1506-related protein [Shewanella sp. Isolate7]|uniref:HI1506-related protein n=1 Tax=Shewanella sp. Isolate7 TaxID=2908528 RepID=UPI001EFD179B|nr:HI1506-related protein [Shewanella sp. Isolate7]MCG9722114.1 HI1506-related protein [Shewanella sp. Isolate7]